ncbi:tetratricopeptide repeat-containing glycosyltransferase family protein [Phenylobacterium sp.]|uniref:tetratricopeptide repeat protein n=1 Tax=Phenylobacterium sp. TaxID=1871053 RepID=UPI0025E0F756|nr:tetratricopeptide repeat-containing glycosyltransferase family protein [Phenylobacterium sp.]
MAIGPSGAEEAAGMLQVALDLHKRGDARMAAVIYEDVLRRDPGNPQAQHYLGLALHHQGQSDQAVDLITQALASRPNDAVMYVNRGVALNALARSPAALADFDRALLLDPGIVQAHHGRAIALRAVGRLEEALAAFDRTLGTWPRHAGAHIDRGDALRGLGRWQSALESFETATALEPNNAAAWYNRGGALKALGRIDEAVSAYDRAIAIIPDFAIAHHNRAVCRLHLGDYPGGLEEYEWRKACPTFTDPRYHMERPWRGEALAGKSLFIYPELFQGDVIQFSRFVAAAGRAGAEVTFAAPRPMHALLRTLGPSIGLLDETEIAEGFDYQSALLSLPYGLGATLETLPAAPYLRADPVRVERWRQVIGSQGFKVGVVWQGSTAPYALPLQRSFPLASLQPLAEIANVRLISLQKVNGLDQLANLPPSMTVEDLGEGFDPGPDIFIDTAAAMSCCDLFITPDTSVAHLAGALGVKTWLALPQVADWRWMNERRDSAWYPSLRLFRQGEPGDWPGVFAAMAAHLASLASG